MKQHYTRYKFTNGMFYKPIVDASIDFTGMTFKVSIMPYFNYIGDYHILSIVKKTHNETIYKTMKCNNGDVVDFDYLGAYNEYYIGVKNNGRIVKIFQSNLEGIILKH